MDRFILGVRIALAMRGFRKEALFSCSLGLSVSIFVVPFSSGKMN